MAKRLGSRPGSSRPKSRRSECPAAGPRPPLPLPAGRPAETSKRRKDENAILCTGLPAKGKPCFPYANETSARLTRHGGREQRSRAAPPNPRGPAIKLKRKKWADLVKNLPGHAENFLARKNRARVSKYGDISGQSLAESTLWSSTQVRRARGCHAHLFSPVARQVRRHRLGDPRGMSILRSRRMPMTGATSMSPLVASTGFLMQMPTTALLGHQCLQPLFRRLEHGFDVSPLRLSVAFPLSSYRATTCASPNLCSGQGRDQARRARIFEPPRSRTLGAAGEGR